MPPIAYPTVQWSTEEMVGPWNHRSFPVYVHLPVKAVCVALDSGFMWLRCIKPRLSGNLPQSLGIFRAFWNYSFRLSTFNFIQEPLRLSGNSPDCPEIFQAVGKHSRLSRNLIDSSKIFQTVKDIFQTVGKSVKLSRNSQHCLDILQTLGKSLILSGNSQDCLKIFQTVSKSSRLYENSQDCPEHFPECPEIFRTVWKSSRLSGNLLEAVLQNPSWFIHSFINWFSESSFSQTCIFSQTLHGYDFRIICLREKPVTYDKLFRQ